MSHRPKYFETKVFPISPGLAMTAREIADAAGISVMTVYNRYNKGIRGKDLLARKNRSGLRGYEAVRCPECGNKFRQDRSHLVYCPKCMIW